MKTYNFSKIFGFLVRSAAALALVSGLNACDGLIYNYEEDCDPDGKPAGRPGQTAYYVDFVYDMNMQFVDGFSQKVRSVDLYVFTESGAFVTKYHEEGAPLSQPGYRMELTDLPAGTYELLAWCGVNGNGGYFSVPTSIGQDYEATCTMAVKSAAGTTYQDSNLGAMFHGRNTSATYTTDRGEQVHTVKLTKDTNNINLTLQHKSGLPFAQERFEVWMTDNNGYLLYDNSLPKANKDVEYRPYRFVYGSTTDPAATVGNFLQVELSTCRLMTDHNPVITVVDTENNGKVIFSIPLVKWALQLRSTNYGDIPEQEYLDREDNYNLMLWLDNGDDGWFGAEIEIEDWHVIDDSAAI